MKFYSALDIIIAVIIGVFLVIAGVSIACLLYFSCFDIAHGVLK